MLPLCSVTELATHVVDQLVIPAGVETKTWIRSYFWIYRHCLVFKSGPVSLISLVSLIPLLWNFKSNLHNLWYCGTFLLN